MMRLEEIKRGSGDARPDQHTPIVSRYHTQALEVEVGVGWEDDSNCMRAGQSIAADGAGAAFLGVHG
jgi:hypothetical protein